MRRQNVGVFHPEWIQPDWLSNRVNTWIAKFGLGILLSLMAAIVALVVTGTLKQPSSENQIPSVLVPLAYAVVYGPVLGIAFSRGYQQQLTPLAGISIRWPLVLLGIMVAFALSTLIIVVAEGGFGHALPMGEGVVVPNWLLIPAVLALFSPWIMYFAIHGKDYTSIERPRHAIRSTLLPSVIAGLVVAIGLDMVFITLILLVLVTGTSTNSTMGTFEIMSTALQQTPWLALMYLVIVMTVFLWPACLLFATMSWLAVGGRSLVQYVLVRLFLHAEGVAPLQYRTFLDSMSEYGLLRRVGAGYVFAHTIIQEQLEK